MWQTFVGDSAASALRRIRNATFGGFPRDQGHIEAGCFTEVCDDRNKKRLRIITKRKSKRKETVVEVPTKETGKSDGRYAS
ncbi:hypothetical protein AOLI_G00047090 [Acnodon oligacanthus]